MSLECQECRQSMGPGKNLPGREGTLVHPSVMSLIYVPGETLEYQLGYLYAEQNRSVCFQCIENALPKERRGELRALYVCYEAEMQWRQANVEAEASLKGFVPLNHPLVEARMRAYEKYKKLSDSVAQDCLFCGKAVETGSPFFTARAIDKSYSGQHLSGLGVPENYSWTNLKEGFTKFRICFEDFRRKFPRAFEQLSYDLLGKDNPGVQPQATFVITPAFEDAAEAKGVCIDDLITRLGDGKMKITVVRAVRPTKQ